MLIEAIMDTNAVREKQEQAAVVSFTSIISGLIQSKLELEATRRAPGSENIGLELSVHDHESKLFGAVWNMAEMGYKPKDMNRLIQEAGKQFTPGEVYMGVMPQPVKKQVSVLRKQVENIYQEITSKNGQRSLF